jgi:hypothetical protein
LTINNLKDSNMKKLYFLLIILISTASFGQIYQEDFETDTNGTNYNTSIVEFSDGFSDFLTRTDGSNINSSYSVSNISNSFYFAAQDIDGEGATNPQNLSTFPIDVTGLTDIDFVILLAEDDDGSNQDWDETDYMHITYSIDGGTAQNVLWVESDGGTNTTPRIDTDFDGVGDGDEITSTFSEFVVSDIPIGGGASIVFTVEFSLNSGDEDIAIDNIRVYDTYVPSPVIITGSDISGLSYIIGGTSPEGSFNVEGMNLSTDIVLTAPTDFEIKEDMGAFGSSITLTQTGGIVSSQTITARLKSGLSVADYSGDVVITSTGATTNMVNLSGAVVNPPTNALKILGVFDGTLAGAEPRGVEIEVLADIPDLSVFGVGSATNGNGGGVEEFSFPAVAATTGDKIYVVAATSHLAAFNTFFGFAITEYVSGAFFINGNDGVEIFEDGFVIDVFGVVTDGSSGQSWDYLDGWAYRTGAGPSTTFVDTDWDYSTGGLDGATNSASSEPYPGATLSIGRTEIEGFAIYPNPVSNGEFSIRTNGGVSKSVQIFDMLGKQVYSKEVQANENVKISNLNMGIYILKVQEEGRLATRKLVVQ